MEVIGIIKKIGVTQTISPTFKKRDLVVTTNEQYPQNILVEFTQDKCDILNEYNNGELVNVGINLRGREWINPQGEAKYFNSIQGWKINRPQAQQSYSVAQNTYPNAPTHFGTPPTNQTNFVDNSTTDNSNENEDDIPF